jgi:hypothetical protein
MVKSRKKRIFDAGNASDEECIAGAFSIEKSSFSPSQEPEKTPEKHPYCVTEAQKGACMRTGLTKQEKTTDIWFDEKEPLIYIRTHNTDLKNRLTAPYSEERRRAASVAFIEKLQLRATQQIERFLLGWYNINTLKLAPSKLHLTCPN